MKIFVKRRSFFELIFASHPDGVNRKCHKVGLSGVSISYGSPSPTLVSDRSDEDSLSSSGGNWIRTDLDRERESSVRVLRGGTTSVEDTTMSGEVVEMFGRGGGSSSSTTSSASEVGIVGGVAMSASVFAKEEQNLLGDKTDVVVGGQRGAVDGAEDLPRLSETLSTTDDKLSAERNTGENSTSGSAPVPLVHNGSAGLMPARTIDSEHPGDRDLITIPDGAGRGGNNAGLSGAGTTTLSAGTAVLPGTVSTAAPPAPPPTPQMTPAPLVVVPSAQQQPVIPAGGHSRLEPRPELHTTAVGNQRAGTSKTRQHARQQRIERFNRMFHQINLHATKATQTTPFLAREYPKQLAHSSLWPEDAADFKLMRASPAGLPLALARGPCALASLELHCEGQPSASRSRKLTPNGLHALQLLHQKLGSASSLLALALREGRLLEASLLVLAQQASGCDNFFDEAEEGFGVFGGLFGGTTSPARARKQEQEARADKNEAAHFFPPTEDGRVPRGVFTKLSASVRTTVRLLGAGGLALARAEQPRSPASKLRGKILALRQTSFFAGGGRTSFLHALARHCLACNQLHQLQSFLFTTFLRLGAHGKDCKGTGFCVPEKVSGSVLVSHCSRSHYSDSILHSHRRCSTRHG